MTRWFGATLGIALAACGGGGDGDGTGLLPLLTEDEFVALFAPGTNTNQFEVCQAGRTIYAAWTERDRTAGAADGVFFQRSLDHGRTWLPTPVRLDDPLDGESNELAMACDGARIYVAYTKLGASSSVRLNRSLDAGGTFLDDDVRVSSLAAVEVGQPVVFCRGADVHVAWADFRPAAGTMLSIVEIRYSRSTDGGATFPATDVRLNTDPPGTGFATRPSLCGDATHVYAAWVQQRSGVVSLRANRSTDGGVTFLPADVAVSHGGSIEDVGKPPALACDGDFLAVAWADSRSAPLGDAFFNRSVDGAATFQPVDLRLRSPPPASDGAFGPVLCRDGDSLHVVWIDGRTGAAELRYARSDDLGATFSDDVAVTHAAHAGQTTEDPRLVCRGDRLILSWTDDRDAATGLKQGFVAVSEDGGDTLTESPVFTVPPGSDFSGAVRPCLDGDELTVLFLAERDGRFQVRVNRTAR